MHPGPGSLPRLRRTCMLPLYWSAFVYNCSTGGLIADHKNRRDHSTQVLLDLSSETLSCNDQICDHTPLRDSSHISCHHKFPAHETHSSGIQHWFKNWQEKRKHKLTASTFAAAIGFWPGRRVQLWLEKLGAIEPFAGNLATDWSNMKEEEALERYKLITGNTVSLTEFQVYGKKYPEYDWLAASPDGVVDRLVKGLPSRGVLEIKCPFHAWPWKRIPLYCIPQAQGLMEILDKDWMDFYVWTVNGSSLFRIYRDVEYWDAMRVALSDFWLNHVQPARELCSKYGITDPWTQFPSLRPAPRHKYCSFLVYESKRNVDRSKLLMCEIRGQLQNPSLQEHRNTA